MSKLTFLLPAEEVPVSHDVDVLVAGGGPAGVAAAISAARSGARTLLIEQRGFLGGMGTVALVPAFCPYSDGEKAVVRGIGLELLERMKAGCEPEFRERFGAELDWVPIDPEVLKRVYDEAVLESGAEVLLHTVASQTVLGEGGRQVQGVVIVNKSGRSLIKAKTVIDTTGDADLAALAGAPFHKGGEAGELQAATMCYLLANVDRKQFLQYLHESGDTEQIHRAVQQAQADGQLPPGRDSVSGLSWVADYLVGVNFGHVFGIDGSKAEDLTLGAIEGRKLVRRQLEFFRAYVPGFGQAHLVSTGEQIGIRETRRITGDYVLTQEDFMNMSSFPDDIARNSYFIDIHMARSSGAMHIHHLPPGKSHGVPYRCMLPLGLDNLWVAGRAASSDRVVQGSLRVMPNCFAMGQAAGLAAAMAAGGDSRSRNVDVTELQRKLVRQGAWLGEGLAVL
ncbi:FAD-dependent oxidoreductase [Paenibacillus sp. MMS20-IR301]|uniref:FAD-dependent oxidoreductase n=1 Tax=Paenibacillus sp. MMS20-IR301 TaxID=2895946 RepID=UPI0028F02F69|nr:FAD-dependent oxidoreductase [Paenibacillus sp. MMS20-IR301]WNS46193.1 FAD-dependent oxidoreductase [Paenibacillus sp. MMS20-IR301]